SGGSAMTAVPDPSRPMSEINPALGLLVDELTRRLQAGEPVDVEEFLAAHPEQAAELRLVIPALILLNDLNPASARGDDVFPPSPGAAGRGLGRLGDFELLREVGR